ncbi:hypothetical protein Bca52824_035379 [Brassica carinata]|uniref:Zinc knuckle CX2CX4HX4C domain-containing protein n=1 Tax=Brassica carinata TaxID=52824 RepID=A0A8X7V1Q7_BRACI|nr:hypothetical protein Bca52824_035379 [Brassica carinata]
MKLDISLHSGEIKQMELEYENLQKHCFICHSLSHDKDDCPSQRAQSNSRESGLIRMGVSQSRTLDKLEMDRRKARERKQLRAESSQWKRPPNREVDWTQERNFRYNYEARRDPNFEVNIQYLEETIPTGGGSNIPSTSRNPILSSDKKYDASQDRSPIRTLSEDRVHVSLRLGPLFDSEEEGILHLPLAANPGKTPAESIKQTWTSKAAKPTYNPLKRGPWSPEDRPRFWQLMTEIGIGRTAPWLLTGDFNDLLDNSEKFGGPLRWDGFFLSFNNFVSQFGLWDLQFSSFYGELEVDGDVPGCEM